MNWFAVGLAGLAYHLLGAAWFTPLFGRAWNRSIGYDRSEATTFGPDYYMVPLVSAVLVTLALGLTRAALALPWHGSGPEHDYTLNLNSTTSPSRMT